MSIIFQPGDPAPHFNCRSSNNPKFHFDTAAGRYLVLSFLGAALNPHSAAVLKHAHENHRHTFDDSKLSFFGVSVHPEDEKREAQLHRLPGYRMFWDFDSAVSRKYGAVTEAVDERGDVVYRPFTLVLDPLLRVIANIPIVPAEEHNKKLDAVIAALPPVEHYAGVKMHAPVLVLPRVFEPEFCQLLIDKYKQGGGQDSGFMREKDGKTVGIIDYGFKRRSDYHLEENELILAAQHRVVRHLIPEIHRAFQFTVTRMERYMVGCYEAETGGFFRPHRDNTTKGTAHRRFAVTINLNAEEFEGGNLRFPEFGPATYRAPTGGAVVFSCSLLHEATPVTKGTRYAFLPFLYDDAAAQIRQENLGFISGETLNLNNA